MGSECRDGGCDTGLVRTLLSASSLLIFCFFKPHESNSLLMTSDLLFAFVFSLFLYLDDLHCALSLVSDVSAIRVCVVAQLVCAGGQQSAELKALFGEGG